MATRGTFTPVFEEVETTIRDRMLAVVDAAGWRTEQGDFPYDVIAPAATELKELERNLDYALQSRFARYATEFDLDEALYEVGLERIQASPNKRALTIDCLAGTSLPAGATVYAAVAAGDGEPLVYTVDAAQSWTASGAQTVSVTCTTAGTVGNLEDGSEFVLQPPVVGVRSITDAGSTVIGRDVETDDDAWARYDYKINHPDTGGNKFDYVRWAGDVEGVGKAKCVPLWNGVNTVKVVLVGNDFEPALPQVVADVQTYIDPNAEGLGEGKAPMGAQTTVIAATALPIDVAVDALQLSPGYTNADVLAAFQASMRDYLKSLVFTDDYAGNPAAVVFVRVLSILTLTPGVATFGGMTVNGDQIDIVPGAEEAPVLGSVTGI